MMEIEILGVKYPVCYTILTESMLDEHFHGIENIDSVMNEKNAHGRIQDLAFILAALVKSGVQREKERCEVLKEEYVGPEAISENAISSLLTPGEITDFVPVIKDAMKGAYKTKIQIAQGKGKNGEATPSE